MNTSNPDFPSLYKLQDEVIEVISKYLVAFYLTGGTALGRCYLHHRYSEDLDFFTDDGEGFVSQTNEMYQELKRRFQLNDSLNLRSESYVSLHIQKPHQLKIDFVLETLPRWGGTIAVGDIEVDNPANILANKLGCIVSRDEPKDVFDIYSLSKSYSFNWRTAYEQANQKQLVDVADIAMRLSSFPVDWLRGLHWMMQPINEEAFAKDLKKISDDLLFGTDNSLGVDKPKIDSATVVEL